MYFLHMIQQHKIQKYGWKRDLPDIHDQHYTLKGYTLPESVDLRPKCPSVYNQGELGSCFHGDTLIKLLNGTHKTLKELYNEGKHFWVYSMDSNGNLVPGKAFAKLTGINKDVIKVTLDNGSVITCTPEHEFLLKDCTYKKAIELTDSDSLMPLNIKTDKDGYEQFYNGKKWVYTHTQINNIFHKYDKNLLLENIGENTYLVTHHCNFNKTNNTPENLKWMGEKDHLKFHQNNGWNGTIEQIEHSREICKMQHKTMPGWQKDGPSKGGKAAWEKANKNSSMKERMLAGFKLGHTKENRKKANESIKNTYSNYTEEQKIEHSNRLKEQWKNVSLETKDKYKEMGSKVGTESSKIKIICYSNRLISKYNKDLTKENWNLHRNEFSKNAPTWNNVVKNFSDINQLKELAINYNHFVTSIEKVNEKIDVYCLEVEEYHNFALSAGVFVHNCTGNAIAGALQFEYIRQGLPDVTPSRLFIYYNERVIEGTVSTDSGAQIRDGIKSVVEWGDCPETEWPYVVSKFADKPSPSCYTDAGKDVVLNYSKIAQNITHMQDCLAYGLPFVFGFTVYSAFESQEVAETGVLNLPTASESVVGGHAVLCVGYDNSTQRVIVRNSWGTGWGINGTGYFSMPYSYITNPNLASDMWAIKLIK